MKAYAKIQKTLSVDLNDSDAAITICVRIEVNGRSLPVCRGLFMAGYKEPSVSEMRLERAMMNKSSVVGISRSRTLLMFIILSAAGCATGIERAYQSEPLPREKAARLLVKAPTQLRSINGDESFDKKMVNVPFMDERRIDFVPGTYRLSYYLWDNKEIILPSLFKPSMQTDTDLTQTYTFEGGKFYQLKYRQTGASRVFMWIEEETDFDAVNSGAYRSYEEGITKYREGKYAEALQLFRKSYLADPKFALPHYYSGWSYKKLGQIDQATQELSSVIRIQPYNADAYLDIARIFYNKNDYASAVPYYNSVLQLRPDIDSLLERGYCNLRLGRYEQVISDLSLYIKENGSDASAYYSRAVAYEKLGEKAKARKDWDTYERKKGASR